MSSSVLNYAPGSPNEVQDTVEFQRVLALPRRDWEAEAKRNDLYLRMTTAFKLPYGKQTLRMIQASALADAHDLRGLLAPIRVGEGKTLASYLLPVVLLGIKRPMLLLPATLTKQDPRDDGKTWREFKELQKHWICHPAFATEEKFLESILTYETLSRESGKSILETRRPDLIIADEVHHLRNREAACTKRFERYMLANPETVFCGMSGTITKRSLRDYWHLMYYALRHNMPLPRIQAEMEKWADCLDERKVDALGRRAPGVLLQFCSDAERDKAEPKRTAPIGRTQQMPVFQFTEKLAMARQGFQRRLRDTPGVVCSPDKNLDCSLVVRRLGVDPGQAVQNHLDILRQKPWQTPNGDLLTTPMDVWRVARELACGFFYSWWNQEAFNTCLSKTLKNVESMNGNAPQQSTGRHNTGSRTLFLSVLKSAVRVTEKDTELVKALAILRSASRTNSPSEYAQGTGSQSTTTKNFSPSTTEHATYAAKNGGRAENGQDVAATASRLITITQQNVSAASSAHLATERLACWVTVLRAYPELSTILGKAVDAAAPPTAWLSARRSWNFFVQEIIAPDGSMREQYRHLHLDSPFQVALAVAGQKTRPSDAQTNYSEDEYDETTGDLLGPAVVIDTPLKVTGPMITDPLIQQAYKDWATIRGTYKINVVAEWVSDNTLNYCVDWAKKEGPAIIWTEHRAFGIKLAERLGTGFCSNGGLDANGRAIEDYANKGVQTVVASVAANKEGRNLQGYNKNLLVTVGPVGALVEQVFGRTHRMGQLKDTVYVDWIAACDEQDSGFQQMLADAQYIQDTTGQSQKLLYADRIG